MYIKLQPRLYLLYMDSSTKSYLFDFLYVCKHYKLILLTSFSQSRGFESNGTVINIILISMKYSTKT